MSNSSEIFNSVLERCLSVFNARQQTPPTYTSLSFFRLPAEIRNQIFDLVYGGDNITLRVKVSRPDGRHHSNQRQCGIDHLLVSMQWFYESVPFFAQSREFEFVSFNDLIRITSRLPPYLSSRLKSISWHADHLRRLELGSRDIQKLMQRLPSLRNVKIHINSMLLIQKASNYSKAITRDCLEASDFASCHGVETLRELRGLDNFCWVECHDVRALQRYYAPERLATWVRNLSSFEEYILSAAGRPR